MSWWSAMLSRSAKSSTNIPLAWAKQCCVTVCALYMRSCKIQLPASILPVIMDNVYVVPTSTFLYECTPFITKSSQNTGDKMALVGLSNRMSVQSTQIDPLAVQTNSTKVNIKNALAPITHSSVGEGSMRVQITHTTENMMYFQACENIKQIPCHKKAIRTRAKTMFHMSVYLSR